MIRSLLIIAGALLLASTGAQAQWTDNFDGYADQAAFNAAWGTGTVNAMTLVSDQSVSAPNSIYQGTGGQQSYRPVGTSVPLQKLGFSFDFNDPVGTGSLARTYGMVYSRVGDVWSGGLNQILAVGKYNGIATTKYSARIAFNPGGTAPGWVVLDAPTSPNRSVGWHTAEIFGGVDPGDPTKATVSFYIDGLLGKMVTGIANSQINFVVMGSNLTSSHGMWYDNVRVWDTTPPVPEPATMALSALGLGIIARLRRKA